MFRVPLRLRTAVRRSRFGRSLRTAWRGCQSEIAVDASRYEFEGEIVADAFDMVVAPDFGGELAAVLAGEEFVAGVGWAVDDVDVAAIGLPARLA